MKIIIMNKISYLLLLICLSITACMEVPVSKVEAGTHHFTFKLYQPLVVGNPTGTQVEAMGVELDPHFFSQNLTRDDGSKPSDWQIVVDRVKKMEIQKFRVMALPQWYEPDGGPLLTSEEYIKMAKVLDARFKKEVLRDKVRFNLSDNTDTRTFYLKECAKNLRDVADIFNSHTYIFGYDTPNHVIFDWEKNNVNIAAGAGKKHLVGEFGSNQCVGSTRQRDIDRYERGVLMTRLVLNFFNAGASGVSYWSLIDQYYRRDADYEQMQQLGLWKYIREAYKTDSTYERIQTDYEVRPQYHSYGLFTRFIKPGAEIYPLDLGDDFTIGTAFQNSDGKWSYLFANVTDESKLLSVSNEAAKGRFKLYRYEENSLPQGDALITSSETARVRDQKLRLEVKPHSVVLCHQP